MYWYRIWLVAEAPVEPTLTVPSALIVSAGIILTVVPASPEMVILGRPDWLTPKSRTYVGGLVLVTVAPNEYAEVRAGVKLTPFPGFTTASPSA